MESWLVYVLLFSSFSFFRALSSAFPILWQVNGVDTTRVQETLNAFLTADRVFAAFLDPALVIIEPTLPPAAAAALLPAVVAETVNAFAQKFACCCPNVMSLAGPPSPPVLAGLPPPPPPPAPVFSQVFHFGQVAEAKQFAAAVRAESLAWNGGPQQLRIMVVTITNAGSVSTF